MGKLSYSRRLAADFFAFAKERKAYWLVPLLFVLALTALLIVSSQASAPFIYTLF
jgi:hypothetical protein